MLFFKFCIKRFLFFLVSNLSVDNMPIYFPKRENKVEPVKVEDTAFWSLCVKYCSETGIDPKEICREMYNLTPLKPIDNKEYESIQERLKNSKRKGDKDAECHFLFLAAMASYSNETPEKLGFYLDERAKLMNQCKYLGSTFDAIRKNPEISFKIANEYYQKTT